MLINYGTIAMSNALNDKEIESVLNKIVDKVINSDPKLNTSPERRQSLVKEMREELRNQHIDMTKSNLQEKKFMDKLFTAVKISLTLNNNKEGLDYIKKMFRLKLDPKTDKKLTMGLLMQKFDKDELSKIMEVVQKLKSDLHSTFKAKPKPGAKPEVAQEDDLMNLTGLINHLFTGSIQIVVQCALGNGRGFPAWGPTYETSIAQIDRQTRTSDTELGDPYGLNALAANNLLTLGDVTPADIEEVKAAARLAPQNTR